jgi:hypothetical protein
MDITNVNKINTNFNNTVINSINNEKKEDKKQDKLESKLTKDGVLLKYGDENKLVKIEGDVNNIKQRLENGDPYGLGLLFGILSSAFEGALKGLGVSLLTPVYPLIPAIIKYIDSYNNVKEEAANLVNKDLDSKNEYEIKKAALKGGLLGGIKALGHGILDLAVIGALTTLGVSLIGPTAFALAPFIGAIYNVAKDDLRLELSKSRENVKINQDNFEKREPFFPFPPEKPANPANDNKQ